MSDTCARHDQLLEHFSRVTEHIDQFIIPVLGDRAYKLSCCSFLLEESEHKNVRLQEIRDRLEALVQVIPELKEMQVGINVNPEEKWDFSLEAVVADLHALEVYANHPAHQEIVKTLIAPVKVDRACVDYRF